MKDRELKQVLVECGYCRGSGLKDYKSPIVCNNCDGKKCCYCEKKGGYVRYRFDECNVCLGDGTIFFNSLQKNIHTTGIQT